MTLSMDIGWGGNFRAFANFLVEGAKPASRNCCKDLSTVGRSNPGVGGIGADPVGVE